MRIMESTYFTGPSSFSFCFTVSSIGDEASTQTSPLLSLMAVERAPTGNKLNREKGLGDKLTICRYMRGFQRQTYQENVQTSFATCAHPVNEGVFWYRLHGFAPRV